MAIGPVIIALPGPSLILATHPATQAMPGRPPSEEPSQARSYTSTTRTVAARSRVRWRVAGLWGALVRSWRTPSADGRPGRGDRGRVSVNAKRDHGSRQGASLSFRTPFVCLGVSTRPPVLLGSLPPGIELVLAYPFQEFLAPICRVAPPPYAYTARAGLVTRKRSGHDDGAGNRDCQGPRPVRVQVRRVRELRWCERRRVDNRDG